jgi:hypothetical protein
VTSFKSWSSPTPISGGYLPDLCWQQLHLSSRWGTTPYHSLLQLALVVLPSAPTWVLQTLRTSTAITQVLWQSSLVWITAKVLLALSLQNMLSENSQGNMSKTQSRWWHSFDP